MSIAVAVAITVALAACSGGGSSASPQGSGSSSSGTPAPAETQVRETGLTPPARPFEGDCANLLSDEEATGILGTSSAAYDDNWEFAPDRGVELHAGIRCQWAPIDGSFASSILVVVLPEGAVSYDPPTGCEEVDEFSQFAQPNCAVESVVNGIRVSGTVWVSASTSEPAMVAHTAFLSIFEQRATAAAPAPTPIPALGAWSLPVDCAAVVAAGDFSDVPGLGAASTGGHVGGTDVWFPPAEIALWGDLGMPFCGVLGESVEVTFVASGGGRWLESTVASSAAPLVLDGYDAAYTRPGQSGLTMVDIFDGPNWLHFQIRFTGNAKPLADALFAALASTAAK